ncbi:MAG: 16S rRNA (cytosine(967)-C(5))-methyltransferase RsmB, partial [Clostridia bacterium]|nr:16S rRNA (cytosine(967)-C(5))-methyltransferase RsmB [Clostridia bacterium]
RKPMNNRRAPERKGPVVVEGLATRRMAWEIIHKVTQEGAYASLLLDEKLRGCGLSPEDRRLVSRLVYDTLENLFYIDEALKQVMAKPDTEPKLVNILRLAACQLMLEDRIPESAAVNTAVALCKEQGMEGLAGVCNGILRNLVRKQEELVWPDPETEPIRARSVKHSVPEWLVRRLDADWGTETADALMAARQQESVTVRPNLMRLDDAEFEALLGKKVWRKEKAAVPHAWHIAGMADIGSDTDFVGGNFSIQGESSMMACLALAPQRGMQVLDACAAPGGKACYLAEMMAGTGRVQAWELHDHRTKLIAAQAKRLGLENIRPMTRDASKLREDTIRTMDAVLVDAPCSGLGTMADKPDVKLRAKEESVAELAALQKQILESCAQYVKPGGVLVYSTCSILKEENEQQVTAFLASHPEFKLEKLPDTIPEQFRCHEDVGLQLLPSRDHVGGFYIARMRRSRV